MKPMAGRVGSLEALRGDMRLSHLSDEEIETELSEIVGALRRRGYEPDCGWGAPLARLAQSLEKELVRCG